MELYKESACSYFFYNNRFGEFLGGCYTPGIEICCNGQICQADMSCCAENKTYFWEPYAGGCFNPLTQKCCANGKVVDISATC